MKTLLISLAAISIFSCHSGPALENASINGGPIVQNEGEAAFMDTDWCDVEDTNQDSIISIFRFSRNGRGTMLDYHLVSQVTNNNMPFTWKKEGTVLRAWLANGTANQFLNVNVTYQKQNGDLQMIFKDLVTSKIQKYGICNL